MELIPILSTIILVATMSTFILAIGAYVLYKVREKKGRKAAVAPQPATLKAEVLVPNVAAPRPQEEARGASQAGYDQQYGPAPYQQVRQSQYGQQQQGAVNYTGEAQPYYPQHGEADGNYGPQEYDGQPQQHPDGSKFLKYTSEGYVPTKEDKSQGALRWR